MTPLGKKSGRISDKFNTKKIKNGGVARMGFFKWNVETKFDM